MIGSKLVCLCHAGLRSKFIGHLLVCKHSSVAGKCFCNSVIHSDILGTWWNSEDIKKDNNFPWFKGFDFFSDEVREKSGTHDDAEDEEGELVIKEEDDVDDDENDGETSDDDTEEDEAFSASGKIW